MDPHGLALPRCIRFYKPVYPNLYKDYAKNCIAILLLKQYIY